MALDKATIKQRINDLKKKRVEALQAKDSQALASARTHLKAYRKSLKVASAAEKLAEKEKAAAEAKAAKAKEAEEKAAAASKAAEEAKSG